MQKLPLSFLISTLLLLATTDCFAGQIKAYVAPFTVTGTANKEELQVNLQKLLLSRLSNDTIVAVESADSADINVKGSYIAFGKVFSIDTVAKSKEGKVLVRAFEQGESPEEMLQAVGKLAKTLLSGIDKSFHKKEAVQVTQIPPPRVEPVAPAAVVIRPEPVPAPAVVRNEPAPPTAIVRVKTENNMSGATWMSQKLVGELTGVALGRKLSTGDREVFITGNHRVQYYRLGKELSLLAEITLPEYKKILGIDVADLDIDGIPEIYLTVMSGENLVSEVWIPEGNTLKQIGDKLPYFFRALTLRGEPAKIYAQQIGRDVDYYGELYEVAKKGSIFGVKNPLKLPQGANLNNCSMIRTKDGKLAFVVLNLDGYLLVFDENGKRLWKSSDKYGGSENFFARDDMQDMRVSGSPQRQVFLQQRLTATKNGEIIVPKNDGFFAIGNNRAYSKNTVFAFAWNGAMLDELWHTKLSQNYLADYQYDEEQKELLLLEVVMKTGLTEKGASALSIKRVE